MDCYLRRNSNARQHRKRPGFSKPIPPSEAMAIAVMSRHLHYRTFKHCWLDPAKGGWAPCFRRLPSHNRFLKLVKGAAMPLYISVATSTLAECAGTSFTGSATIGVCGIHREKQEACRRDTAAETRHN
ncbi:MAG: hypothetical protein FWG10_07795 [Eubacteriaceae bacterium]|nr:hypothetical protein [Eubacteriaceae bacterium]